VTEVKGLAGVPLARRRTFRRGEFVLHADGAVEAVYCIRRGQVRCFLLDGDGRETTTAVLGHGQLVGVAALAGHAIHHEFAQALSNVEAWVMPTDELRNRLPVTPDLQGLALGCLAPRFEFALGLLKDVCLLAVADPSAKRTIPTCRSPIASIAW
jgi:CRP-like cAMP-binding protein